MSNPPPPGYKSNSSTPQPHPSLPARPPPPAQPAAFSKFSNTSAANGKSQGAGGYGAFTGFKPRSVASNTQAWQSQPPTVSAGPQPSSAYPAAQSSYAGGGYQQPAYQQQPSYYQQPSADPYSQATPPQIRNPFPAPGQNQGGSYGAGNSAYDPEYEAQIAQWQSAYANRDDTAAKGAKGRADMPANANNTPLGEKAGGQAALSNKELQSAVSSDTGVAAVVSGPDGKQKTVVRQGGGQTWSDTSLLEWDPAHFRLFVGNLAGEVTDESLYKAFSRFTSIQKARVVRDKRTTKSKGYGFVSFSNGDDYFQAAKEMQGKYIGSHPVLVKRSTTEIKAVVPKDNKKNNKGGKHGGHGHGGHANTGAGVQKKQSKTKGGLKILG
ncbi:Rnp domain protein [Neofusicoccum parvum]|uniref:RRM domain-containing protein n=1 Tax=Neofusicoccum ribis TaxID=45134 RepID=A0ABR3SYQ5_9PEZI|nr:Rnp domain protein [Neofusicoccum parvum]